MQIILNESQNLLINKMMDFWKSSDQYFLIAGQAGVGKTTCVKMFIKALENKFGKIKICCSAPTNKATSVLRETVGRDDVDYRTIYSVLGLRMEANGGIKELKDSGGTTIEGYDLVILDEGSMISEELLEYIQSKTVISGTKMIIIGDKAQLPPVGEEGSPVWKHFKTDFVLTEVMRHKNSILKFVQSIRDNPNPVFESTGPEVSIDNDTEFMGAITDAAKRGEFHSGFSKAIAWRNVTVDFLNKLIREVHTPGINAQFVIGDRVVFKEPVITKFKTTQIFLAHTDQEGVVVSAQATSHSKYHMLKTWKLDIKLDNGKSLTSYVIHKNAESLLNEMLQKYANEKKWYLFWQMKEAFNSVSHSYAITTHRSQGSTFENVFVEAGDILLNKNVEERTQCLYVAAGRASKQLHIFPP